MKVMITGSSSGLGYALAERYLAEGALLYGLGREIPQNAQSYRFVTCDLGSLELIESALSELLHGVKSLDLLYLNAGTLGHIQDMSACSMEELKQQMDVNLWANKVILDYLIHHQIAVKQVIAISSGASQSGSLGWNGYSLSKAALNMLVKLYASEMPYTHLSALAPGLIDSPMLRGILEGDHDTKRYTTVQRLRESKKDGQVRAPEEAAELIDSRRELLLTYESGSYVDIRQM